ncbi:MAG: hypothetical protein LAO78_05495 [Acidobacteriia bacterium]|nr:hypothetical protein [Terriglobia bacterium]
MPNENDPPVKISEAITTIKAYLNPIVTIAFGMLLAIVLLIGATTLGLDKGLVLTKMGQVEFARGLITYLFAVVTIGTAVVLVVSALTSDESPANERRFERGKEILSLLLGVFGTIVGFYFGSEVAAKGQPGEAIVKIAPLRLNTGSVASGADFTLTTYVSGGKAPYKYGVGFDKDEIKAELPVDPNGWITKTLAAPKVTADRSALVRVVVEDADGHSTEATLPLAVKSGP